MHLATTTGKMEMKRRHRDRERQRETERGREIKRLKSNLDESTAVSNRMQQGQTDTNSYKQTERQTDRERVTWTEPPP